MGKKAKLAAGAGALALVILVAVLAYNALGEKVAPGIVFAGEQVSLSGGSGESQPGGQTAAPDFTVEDAEGRSVTLSDMRGRPVVLNFWASWCPPCKSEMPEFESVYTELWDEVAFMMVDMTDGQRETRADGEAYVAEQGYSFPVYYDTEQQAAEAYGVRAIPMTVFIDEDGNIAATAQGAMDEEALCSGIDLIWDGGAAAEDTNVPIMPG